MQKKKKFLQIEHEFQLGFIGVWISVENLNHNIILPRIRKSAKSFYIVKYLMSKWMKWTYIHSYIVLEI